MTLTRIFRLSPLALLVACGPSRNDFYNEYWTLLCEKMETCDDGFSDSWSSVDACVEAMDDEEATLEKRYEDCDYDKDEAQECLHLLDSMECDAYPDALADVEAACAEVHRC
jgi:hypothetical protein